MALTIGIEECLFSGTVDTIMDWMPTGRVADLEEASTTTVPGISGLTQTQPPGPLGQFKTCLVKPLTRFLTLPYLRAQRILHVSRTVGIFHMQSIYIARQALHLVILLNDHVDANEGPDDEQYEERINLEDDLIELLERMKDWGTVCEEAKPDYQRHILAIEAQYVQFFRSRPYFHKTRIPLEDTLYQKLVVYDQRTITFRRWVREKDSSSTGFSLHPSTVRDEGSTRDTLEEFYPTLYRPESLPGLDMDMITDDGKSSGSASIYSQDKDLLWAIEAVCQRPDWLTSEIPNDLLRHFNSGNDTPGYTCKFTTTQGEQCHKEESRPDRFKHHIQSHLGITPYSCAECCFSEGVPELACDAKFSTMANRRAHVRNKRTVKCDCGVVIFPRNLARHQRGACANRHQLTKSMEK